jgi:hypothetical protein
VLPKRKSGSENRVIKEESLWTEIMTEQKSKEKNEKKGNFFPFFILNHALAFNLSTIM